MCYDASGRPFAPAARLHTAVCALLTFDLRRGQERLDEFEPSPVRGHVGVLKGLTLLLAGRPDAAMSAAVSYNALCARKPEACPGATRPALYEIVTLATAYVAARPGVADRRKVIAFLREHGLYDHEIALRWRIAVEQGHSAAQERLRDWRSKAMAREHFATEDGPLRGERAALSKPMTLITEVFAK
jgi:hypothetical protein